MKRKWLKKATAMLLVCAVILSASACANSSNPSSSPAADDPTTSTITETPATTETPAVTDTPAATADDNVYETSLDAVPDSWNPHTWTTVTDMVMLEYLTTPIVANVTSGASSKITFVNKAATEVTDITADFADKEKWNIDKDAVSGYVYQLDLNPLLTWEDGTPINADTYINSMKTLLDPDMGNHRAGRYTVGAEAIRGAFNYLNRNKAGQPRYVDAIDFADKTDIEFFLNLTEPCFFFNSDSIKNYYDAGFKPNFFNDDDVDLYEKYAALGDYIPVTEEMKTDLLTWAVAFGDTNPGAWVEFCFVKSGVYQAATWDEVGLIKTGEYQLLVLPAKSMNMEKFQVLMKRNWIVHEKTYEAGKTTVDGVTTTNYNIADGTTMSYGPYKLLSFEVGKEIILEKNENWYGWAEGTHKGIYTNEKFGTQDTVRIELPEIKTDSGSDLGGASIPLGEAHPFPFAFETTNVFGEAVTAETLGDKEIFFVHLWATWCGPCVSEMGDMAKIAEMYGDRVGFLALVDDFDTNTKGAARLLEYNGITFTNINSKVPELSELLQMIKSGYIPTTIIIDGQGNIIGEKIVGSYGMEYADYIDAALEEANKK